MIELINQCVIADDDGDSNSTAIETTALLKLKPTESTTPGQPAGSHSEPYTELPSSEPPSSGPTTAKPLGDGDGYVPQGLPSASAVVLKLFRILCLAVSEIF